MNRRASSPLLSVRGSLVLFAGAVALLGGAALRAAPPPAAAVAFIDRHCADCHSGTDKEAGLDLASLDYDPVDGANFALWVRVHDRVKAGEMPPKKKKTRPQTADLETFVQAMAATLTASERARVASEGRSVQRRLNRYEYENALRDLLNVPWAQVRDKLPLEGERHGFNKSGEALDVSFVQLERYLSAADYAMRQAMSAAFERPTSSERKIYARDAIRGYQPRENGTLPDRLAFPVLDSHAQPEVRAGRAPATSPETREREAVGKVSSIFSDAGGYFWGFSAPTSGRYRIRLKGYTIWVSGGGIGRWMFDGQGAEKAPTYWLPVWHRPNADEIWPGRNREPIGFYASSSGQTRPIGVGDFSPDPSVVEIEAQLAGGESIRTDAMRFFRTRVNGTDEQYVNPLATTEGMPGYAVQWLEVEGPIEDPAATSGYKLLFGDLPMRRLEAGKTGGVLLEGVALGGAGGGRGGFGGFGPGGPGGGRGGPGPAGGRGGRGGGGGGLMVDVISENPEQDADRLLRGFLRTAYRRPVREVDAHRFLGLFQREFAQGSGFARSMLVAYTGVLASPGFVFVDELPGRLNDMALATRLALFLWNSTPDAVLRARAEQGELHRPEVLRAETERLLNDPRSSRFVEAFTDYWLDLRKIDDTSPSSTIYNDYEMDDPLKLAALDETRLFFAELVRADLPARHIVNSDFTFLNGRLAAHYEIPGVEGAAMRRVTLPQGSDRGGLMTMASVLKVTANGTTTSPVLRGHWITERVLGVEIQPPPAGVKAVEPDIRGAVTIRQQLAKHREDPSCASCHIKMDPPGFALENYDVMGGRRDRYRAVAENVPPVRGFGMSGQAFAFHYGLPVDSAGELPDGRPFENVREFKALVLQDELPVARNLVRQLVTFATGAPVGFADRPALEKILQNAAPGHYGVRTLIHEIVQSELYLNK
jgi:mono/diheme cytochrome c family protein